ncbi:MAG: hypothetical protein GTO08_10205 [Deltaproteobacteria bacterium]|nr:hypothetical protein [Deltaproteobacteria bacterium]
MAIDTCSVRKAPVIIEEVKVSGPSLDKKAIELAQNDAAKEAEGTLKKLPGK